MLKLRQHIDEVPRPKVRGGFRVQTAVVLENLRRVSRGESGEQGPQQLRLRAPAGARAMSLASCSTKITTAQHVPVNNLHFAEDPRAALQHILASQTSLCQASHGVSSRRNV